VSVAAIVAQRGDKVRQYFEKTGIELTVLVDETREVVKAYGVWHRLGLDAWNIARPALFLIAPDRRIHFSFVGDSQGEFPGHEDIVGAIETLKE
jgi:methyl-accepting chemotaxis protein